MKVLLVASTGGHLAQLIASKDAWQAHERRWVTFQKTDAETALCDEDVTWAYHPTTRHLGNALRNLVLALGVMTRWRPDVLVSTGAGVALPFFVVARLLRVRTVFVEVFDRIDQPTLTGLMVYPLADAFLLQWDEQRRTYPEGTVVGCLL